MAFLSAQVNRTYFVPLDRLFLLNKSAHPSPNVNNIHFGPNEVAFLTHTELSQRIPLDGLKRFGHRYIIATENLNDRYWLIVNVRENAGAIWERGSFRFMYEPIGEYRKMPMFKPTFPMDVENALFVLLLSLSTESRNLTQDPFLVPWIYSFTDDPFSNPEIAPDPSALSWTIVGDPDQEFHQVPDQSNTIELTEEKLECLCERWHKFQTVLANKAPESANFNPLTLHFFIKAFTNEGIDEIIAAISCIEATLQLPEEKGSRIPKRRYKRLVNDKDCNLWIDRAYSLRNKYLHSAEEIEKKIDLKLLSKTRLMLVKGVDAYVNIASQRCDLNRKSLLHFLSNK